MNSTKSDLVEELDSWSLNEHLQNLDESHQAKNTPIQGMCYFSSYKNKNIIDKTENMEILFYSIFN